MSNSSILSLHHCLTCGKVFTTLCSFQHHFSTCDPTSNNETETTETTENISPVTETQNHVQHLCPVCFVTFKTQKSLRRHKSTHTFQKHHLCCKCRASFHLLHQLKNHKCSSRTTHHPSSSASQDPRSSNSSETESEPVQKSQTNLNSKNTRQVYSIQNDILLEASQIETSQKDRCDITPFTDHCIHNVLLFRSQKETSQQDRCESQLTDYCLHENSTQDVLLERSRKETSQQEGCETQLNDHCHHEYSTQDDVPLVRSRKETSQQDSCESQRTDRLIQSSKDEPGHSKMVSDHQPKAKGLELLQLPARTTNMIKRRQAVISSMEVEISQRTSKTKPHNLCDSCEDIFDVSSKLKARIIERSKNKVPWRCGICGNRNRKR